jgi:hypothetical protein
VAIPAHEWSTARKLLAVKVLHTVVWAFFAGAIVAIPVLAWGDHLLAAGLLCGFVFVEVIVLALNGWACPLTPIAARYTFDRRDNFDIFLPEWLARHNKVIFGGLFVVGLVVLVTRLIAG